MHGDGFFCSAATFSESDEQHFYARVLKTVDRVVLPQLVHAAFICNAHCFERVSGLLGGKPKARLCSALAFSVQLRTRLASRPKEVCRYLWTAPPRGLDVL
jgi:hypothetical protein